LNMAPAYLNVVGCQGPPFGFWLHGCPDLSGSSSGRSWRVGTVMVIGQPVGVSGRSVFVRTATMWVGAQVLWKLAGRVRIGEGRVGSWSSGCLGDVGDRREASGLGLLSRW